MSLGPTRLAWDQTSFLACLQCEMNRDPKQRREPFTPADFHPLEQQHREPEDRGPDLNLWHQLTRNAPVTELKPNGIKVS